MLQPGDSSANIGDMGAEEETVMASRLVGDSATISTVVQELEVPEMPAAIVSLANPVQFWWQVLPQMSWTGNARTGP